MNLGNVSRKVNRQNKNAKKAGKKMNKTTGRKKHKTAEHRKEKNYYN